MLRLLRSTGPGPSLAAPCKRFFAAPASDIGEIGVISGAPESIFKRKVNTFTFLSTTVSFHAG